MTTDEVNSYDRIYVTAENVKGMDRDEFIRAVKNLNKWVEEEA